MSGAAASLFHHHGVSVRATLPVYHGDCVLFPGACFLNKSPTLGSMNVSLSCGASPNNYRPRNSDISGQQKGGSSKGKGKRYQGRDDSDNNDEFDTDIMFSKNGRPISLGSNSRPQVTSTPGEREKEIVELFKRVQAQLRARGKGREDKKPEPAKAQGESGSVDSLLNLLRKHSVDQRRKSSDEKERNFDQTWRSDDSGNKQNTRIFGIKNDTQEGQKPPTVSFRRPASSFRRRSPVPGVKFQPVTIADADADAKSITNGMVDALPKAKTPLDNNTATDDELDASDIDESNEVDLESLENADVTDSNLSDDKSLECSSAQVTDISSLKVTELKELAKSRGIKGYSKLKKHDLVAVLSRMA